MIRDILHNAFVAIINLFTLPDVEFSYADISGSAKYYLADVSGVVDFAKLIAAILTVIMGAIFIWLFIQMIRFKRTKVRLAQTISPPPAAVSGALAARWQEITHHIESPKEGEWKFAVIEADKLIDDTLKNAGFPGETMGERLMAINSGQLQSLEGLWEAHKIRNRLAHDAHYFLRHAEARRAVELFGETFKELGVL